MGVPIEPPIEPPYRTPGVPIERHPWNPRTLSVSTEILWLSKRFTNLFHPHSVCTHVGLADPGCRAKVDVAGLSVDDKLDIISKAKKQTGRYSVKVAFCFRYDLHSWDDGENCFKFPHGIFWRPIKHDCLNLVLPIFVLGRNAIRRVRAGCKTTIVRSKVLWLRCQYTENDKGNHRRKHDQSYNQVDHTFFHT